VLALQLEAQLATLHGDELHAWAVTRVLMGLAATWLRSTWAPTVFCPFLGKGFRASKQAASTKATMHAVATTGGMSVSGPSRPAARAR